MVHFSKELNKEEKHHVRKVIENVPIDNPIALGSYWYNDYKSVIWPRYFDGAMEKITESSGDSVNIIIYELIAQNFSEMVMEQYLAYNIRSNAIKNKFHISCRIGFGSKF